MKESITLYIENLTCEAIIGVLPFERYTPQKLIIEADITYMYSPAQAFLDYAHICESIQQYLQNGTYELLESALIDITQKLKTQFPAICTLTLCIKKPNILDSCIVGASITRHFKDSCSH
ncbi:dihydroneopterin aldolase [uncultured Helicobacter sp.]|uniref:dihydroneopterin aldolase n=1 Tax=uncultured Helicobacter sp. TaxID=175537 RepID=UPI0025E58E5F|nr:dihydroneopterin aldolase [uncultured Helicobacter sp.]